jgi:hypothetical protein
VADLLNPHAFWALGMFSGLAEMSRQQAGTSAAVIHSSSLVEARNSAAFAAMSVMSAMSICTTTAVTPSRCRS